MRATEGLGLEELDRVRAGMNLNYKVDNVNFFFNAGHKPMDLTYNKNEDALKLLLVGL